MNRKFRVLIPAGGRSSRSGLSYPKTLYRLRGIPILIGLLQKVEKYDQRPIIIINPAHEALFSKVLHEFNRKVEFVFQPEPKGMGNAVLQADNSIASNDDVILTWSDIPLLNETTIDHLVKCHQVSNNDFSLVTSIGENCYTIVERDNTGKLVNVIETKAAGIKPPDWGEREIGLFVFKKEPVFKLLRKDQNGSYEAGKNEHGFLYNIEILAKEGKKIEGYPIALPQDLLSFNTPEDLQKIENVL